MPCGKMSGRHYRWLWIGGLATVMILSFPGRSMAQWFRLGEWEGAYESLNEYARQNISTGNSESSRFQNVRSENRLSIRNAGAYIYDPRLINLSVGGTFGLSQNWQNTNGGSDFLSGT